MRVNELKKGDFFCGKKLSLNQAAKYALLFFSFHNTKQNQNMNPIASWTDVYLKCLKVYLFYLKMNSVAYLEVKITLHMRKVDEKM